MRRLLPALLIAAVLPGGCGIVHNHIYYPPHAPLRAADLPAGGRLITVTTTRDGLRLTGAAVPASGDRPTLLVFHGNAASSASTLNWFPPLIAGRYGFVAG